MALLVGIDEAGYGPHLGPLVVSAAAIEFDEADSDPAPQVAATTDDARPDASTPDPDLWGPMRHWVRRQAAGASRRVVICDSKEAFTSADRDRGLAILERTVLAFLAASGQRPTNLSDLLAATAAGEAARDSRSAASDSPPWHRPDELRLPHRAEPADVAGAGEKLARALEAVGGRAARLWVNPAPAVRLNRLMNGSGRNKAQALFALTAELLAALRRFRPACRVRVLMDQHGGRRYYESLLAGVFPMERVEVLDESGGVSRYRVGPAADGDGAAGMEIEVRPGCERRSLPTALASMAAKYVRELAMHELNGYFCTLVPGLRPTAGYGRDARRFLTETGDAREAARVPLEMLLRAR